MAAKPLSQGWFDWVIHRFVGWRAGLPPPSSSYTVQTVKIPLAGDDNIQLVADLYQPTHGNPPSGTILIQCPYGRGLPLSLNLRIWACYGYNVLLVSTRSTFGSSGALDPARTDSIDGPRVVAWMRAQPWYTGTFATLGPSYLGFTQWALLNADPPLEDMVAAIISVGPQNFGELLWGTGALWLPLVDWAQNMAQQGSTSMLGMLRAMLAGGGGDRMMSVKKSLPLVEGARAELGDRSSWLYELLTRPDIASDPHYHPMKQGGALEKTKVPILLVSGWYDICTTQTMAAYQRLQERSCTVALTVGPWNHGEAAFSGLKESFDWLEKYLAKRTMEDIRPSPVRINITGANEWRWLPVYPPPTSSLDLFLDPKGALSWTQLVTPEKAQFTFDPHSPTPSIGGPFLMDGGSVDDSALAKRPDVLSFTSPPLTDDIEVLGKPSIVLLHSSDTPHVDLFVRLSEVAAGGRTSRNLCEVYKRLDPGRAHTPGAPIKVELALSDCAHRFKKGTQIRVVVAGGCFPLYSFNLGSGEPQGTGTTVRSAVHGVHCGGEGGSRLVLPVA
ncbi:Cocaine esterase [Mycena sanguinolenta]|uniref:Cocaine esterase n=1 Tax=Mycena sanguinolenta TaxID=230812 RepID=A0A8H6TW90_9AGAR|nr:Cocaine esterase [Mycena sanguinolenta]